MAQNGTTLQISNKTASPVSVMITLGCCTFDISNINQLPSSWNVQQAGSAQQGIFTLAAAGGSNMVSFNSGRLSFSGNIAFGPTFTNRGCGSSANNACYPNATNLAEFTLNMPGETLDISGVNGTNALIAIHFLRQTSSNRWNDGEGGNRNVTNIANQAITSWTAPSGVYGWQATNCTFVYNPPNPISGCAAPLNKPSGPQLQSKQQCNIQRSATAPTGGIVAIVFGGYTTPPPPGCN